MALFSSRKRQDQPTLAPVSEATPAPLPTPAQPVQSSSAPLGAGLRLVTAPDAETPASTSAPDPAPSAPAQVEAQETRADDLRGLPLGTILFRQGLVEQQELEGALAAGMESGERLGEVLIRRELVSEDDIARGLAAQQGLAFLHAEDLTFDSAVSALLPTDEARSLGAVAVRHEHDGVLVATPDPSARQRDRLEARLGQRVIEVVVSRGVFDQIVENLDAPAQPVVEEATVPEPVAEVVESTEEPQFGERVDFAPADDETESADESQSTNPVDEAPELARRDEEELMDQAWTEAEAVEDGASAPESWSAPTTPEEIWGTPAAEPESTTVESSENGNTNGAVDVEHAAVADHVEQFEQVEQVEQVEEFQHTDQPEQFEHVEASWASEPETTFVSSGDGSIDDLGAQHDASVGRIDDLLTRINEGASAFVDLRSQINGLSDSLRTTEETLADREHRLGELVTTHESDQRRIDELVGQLRERENALSGLGERVEDLTGRLGSAEERLDERERRLAELDASLGERMRYVEALSAQVERRDNALGAFEQKLNAIAAHFVADHS